MAGFVFISRFLIRGAFRLQQTPLIRTMPRCVSVKNKSSELQCSASSIGSLNVCGRHARAKKVRVWADVNVKKIEHLVRAQALVRGWLIRKFFRLCGPGVLSRANLANDEEIVTCEEKGRQSPHTYFAFKENDKVWWFEFASLWTWASRSFVPSNPYTKVPLSTETRKRLREMWAYRRRHSLPVPEEPAGYSERLSGRWNTICQTFVDNGFTDIEPRMFFRLSKINLVTTFQFLHDDIRVAMRESNPARAITMTRCNRMIKLAYSTPSPMYMLQSTTMLMLLITEEKEPYSTIFMLMSAFYRS